MDRTVDRDGGDLEPREDARTRRRDRRRRTAMVVDNAGVKRIQLALRERAVRAARPGPTPPPPPA